MSKRTKRDDEFDMIERKHRVNIDVTDEDGCTTVYAYADPDGHRIAYKFDSMTPPVDDVRTIAAIVGALRIALSNLGATDTKRLRANISEAIVGRRIQITWTGEPRR